MRHVAIGTIVCAAGLACTPRVPPPPEILPLDTDALAVESVEGAQGTAERVVALAGVVGAFIGSGSELSDAVSDGGLDRVVERALLASAACDAIIERDAAGAVHASWRERCTLATGTVVSGDLTVIESSDGNALTVLLAATGDGLTLNGFVGLTPQFWPIAWLLSDFLGDEGIATAVVFDAQANVARDGAGVFVVELPMVLAAQLPYGAHIGGVGGRVCAVEGRSTVLYGLGRRADRCQISLAGLDITMTLGCALVASEHSAIAGIVRASVPQVSVGTVDAVLSEGLQDRPSTRPISLELRPLGCRER